MKNKLNKSGIQFNIISQRVDAPSLGGYSENHYILFHKGNIGYALIYEVPPGKEREIHG